MVQIKKPNKIDGLHPKTKAFILLLYIICTFVISTIKVTRFEIPLYLIPWFGVLLILFAIFNAIFLPRYFRESHKSGKHFLIALIGVFLWVTLFEGILIASSAAGQYIPFFGWIRDNLDAFPKTPGAWTAQGILLAVCALSRDEARLTSAESSYSASEIS